MVFVHSSPSFCARLPSIFMYHHPHHPIYALIDTYWRKKSDHLYVKRHVSCIHSMCQIQDTCRLVYHNLKHMQSPGKKVVVKVWEKIASYTCIVPMFTRLCVSGVAQTSIHYAGEGEWKRSIYNLDWFQPYILLYHSFQDIFLKLLFTGLKLKYAFIAYKKWCLLFSEPTYAN